MEKIKFSCPSGFPEFLPGEKRLELQWMDKIRAVFERYGFTPIETPSIERLEVLQAKNRFGESQQGDNIVYSIAPLLPPEEAGNAEEIEGTKESRGLKFDQTVPLAAYIARHQNELVFPFARYQMDHVFRGERAKSGRYRQFRQCDIDVVADGELNLMYDAQVAVIIAEVFESLKIGNFLIRLNNRKILTGFFESLEVSETQVRTILKIVDTLEKIGPAKVHALLLAQGLKEIQIAQILEFTAIQGASEEVLARLRTLALAHPKFQKGLEELTAVIEGVRHLGLSETRFQVDLSIARGLNYYTGTVYETTLIGHEGIGSICSGGRYEELVGLFVGRPLPGVGISIGLTRLINQLLKAGVIQPFSLTPTQILVLNVNPALMPRYLQISQQLRQAGWNVVTNFQAAKLGKQFQHANKLGIPLCVILGEDEVQKNEVQIKNMLTGEQIAVALPELNAAVQRWLGT